MFREIQTTSVKFRLNSTKSKTVMQIHTNSDTQNRTWSKFIQWITSDFPFPLFPFSVPLYCGGPWKPGGGPTSLLPEEVTSFLGVTNAATFPTPDVPAPAFSFPLFIMLTRVGLPEKPGGGPMSLLLEEVTSS